MDYLTASKTFLLMDSFWLQNITMDHHILAHINMECLDDRQPKLKIYISEIISDSYKYIPVPNVEINFMI
jgi:hypothetical protein